MRCCKRRGYVVGVKRLGVAVCAVVALAAASVCRAGEMKYAVGLNYVSGFLDVGEFIEDSLQREGYSTDLFYLPVGLDVLVGYQTDPGVSFGVQGGPFALLFVDVLGGPYSGDYFCWDIPLSLWAGYVPLPKSKVSPYVRGGVRQHIGGGDFFESADVGLFGAAGVTFFNDRRVQVQLEVSYDTSEATYEDFTGNREDIEPHGLVISARAVF